VADEGRGGWQTRVGGAGPLFCRVVVARAKLGCRNRHDVRPRRDVRAGPPRHACYRARTVPGFDMNCGPSKGDVTLVKKLASASALMTVVLGTAQVLPASAQSVPVGGAIRIWATPALNGAGASIVITGAIGDYGKALSVNANGTANPNGNYVKITLHRGGFTVNSTTLNQKSNNAQPIANMTTCSAWLSVSGPVTLSAGTGLYKGISGTVNVTQTFAFIIRRYAIGAHAGQCNMSQKAQPVATWASIVGSGNVSFASM
jgi:hypothetical protein